MVRSALVPALLLCASLCAAQTPSGQQQPARDTSAQKAALPTGSISGRVVGADNGKPVKRASVMVTAAELNGARAAMTDDAGMFELTGLPAGRYTLTVSKTGYISLSYGQRRPLQAGTPLQLADGQQMNGIDFRLPRGGAIAGRILDEDGDPMPGATVRVMRYQYAQGNRQLVPAATAQTDDKGDYRAWDLLPGDYYVSATARSGAGPVMFFMASADSAAAGGGRGGRGGGGLGGGRGGFASDDQNNAQAAQTYAATYFPGVGSVADAKAVTVGVSQEVLDITFGLQLVQTSRVSGRVMSADGSPAYSGTVSMTPEGSGSGGGRGQMGTTYGGRIQWDGGFVMTSVAPGRYVLRARGGENDAPQFAQQALTIGGGDISDLVISLAPGGTITGAISFQSSSPPPDATQIRVTAPAADPNALTNNAAGRTAKDGTFTLGGVPTGPHFIRANNARGWTLKSVMINGRETIDTPIEVASGRTLAGVTLVFSDKLTQISGVVTDEQSNPMTEYTVLAFPLDNTLWRPQSRQIMTARPDQNGKYQLRGLPPGEYYMATVDPAVQGEWFEPAFLDAQRASAVRITLSDGDVKTQDFKVSVR